LVSNTKPVGSDHAGRQRAGMVLIDHGIDADQRAVSALDNGNAARWTLTRLDIVSNQATISWVGVSGPMLVTRHARSVHSRFRLGDLVLDGKEAVWTD
jgi:hypothetical protein